MYEFVKVVAFLWLHLKPKKRAEIEVELQWSSLSSFELETLESANQLLTLSIDPDELLSE